MSNVKILRGPKGYSVTLDKGEVFLNDPGAGTPAMVYNPDKSASATYWCAADTGELDGRQGTQDLPRAVADWLDSVSGEVNAFLYP